MAISSNLGSLTLDLIANTGGFTGPLDQAARITKKQMKEMGMAVDEFGNYTDKAMKQAAQATKQLDTQFEKLAENLQRETALYGETSRAAQMRYDLEKGALQNLSAAQKDSLTEMTRRLSAMESANAAFREQAAEMAKVNGLYLQHEQAMKREIALYGETSREAKIRYEIERGALATLSKDKQFKLLLDARALDAMDAEAAKSKQLAAAAKQLDATHEQLNESMLAQLATYGQVTRVAKLRYDMERGALRGLTEAQKQSSLQLAQQLDALDKAAQGSMRGIRGVATGIGYQVQDIAVQLQMGTNPLMVFAQQGSQIASLFGPTGAVAGAVIAIGGALAGALIPNLFKTGDATEEVADKVSALVSEMDKLTERQQKIVAAANAYRISDKAKEYDDLTKSIAEQRKEVEKLNEENNFVRFNTQPMMSGMGASLQGSGLERIDNADKLIEANRKLEESQANLVALERELAGLRDPAKLRENLNAMQQELELLGLSSAALYEKEAAQKGYTGALAEEYIYLKLVEEETKARIKAEEDAAKAREDAAKKAAEDEKSRADSIAKTIAGMEREIALYGVMSKAAQIEYDILNGVLKVKGGLEGVEGRRLVTAAKALDTLDAEKKAQEDYVAKMKEWVKGENDKVAAVDKIIAGLEKQRAELGLNADAYLEMQLRALGATDARVKEALALAKGNREMAESAKASEEMFKRLDEVAANVWTDMLTGSKSAWDGIKDIAISTIAEIAHEAYTKPIVMRIQQQFSVPTGAQNQGNQQAAGGAISAGGWWGVLAVAVAAGVNEYNKNQSKAIEKMTAEFRQGNQSIGTILGEANAKSESISGALETLGDLSGDTLNVNHSMYRALVAIESGINGVAAGFARQFGIKGVGSSLGQERSGTFGLQGAAIAFGDSSANLILGGLGDKLFGGQVTDFVKGFMGGITDKISKAIYSNKTKVIDSGIVIGVGNSLADIMAGGMLEAFAYADVQTKKKFLGVTTSNKVKTQQEALDALLLGQFTDVFAGAGEALSAAAGVFGLEFQDYVDRLVIDPQKLSLKDLEGEALTKEVEAFFSSTLDNWAGVLTGGTDVLEKFQQVGEGAFETIVRLANELNTFNQYVDFLDLNFTAVGFAAVEAAQAIAEAAGGFDQLAASLSTYYSAFYSDAEKFDKESARLKEAFSELGYSSIPETRAQFKAMVDAIDLTTAAGQKQFAALVALAGVTDEYVDTLDRQRDALNEAVFSAFAGLGRAVQRERELLDTANKEATDAINASLDTHRALANALSGTLASMTLESEKYQEQSRRQAQAEVIAANAIRRAGGPLPDLEKLAPALEALSRPSSSLFSTFEDYARDFYATQNALKELESSAVEQVSVDEKMLQEQEDYFAAESKRFDDILEYYQLQVDTLKGVDNSVLSVADAVDKLTAAFQATGVVVVPPSAAPAVTLQADRTSVTTSGSSMVVGQSFSDMIAELKGLRESLETSQYAIAKNTNQSNALLQRWEVDGLPPERVE